MGIIILSLATCILARREGIINNFQELKNTISEARIVRDDLNHILEKSLDVSREIVNNIDSRLAGTNLSEPIEELKRSSKDDSGRETDKIRVYELARALGIKSKELIKSLQAIGYTYSSPLNTLDENTAAEIKERLIHHTEAEAGIFLKQEEKNQVVVENEVTDEADTFDHVLTLDNFQEMDTWIESLKEAHPYLAVKTLADNGYSVRAIAKLLNRGQGEVSLILNLLNKKRAYM